MAKKKVKKKTAKKTTGNKMTGKKMTGKKKTTTTKKTPATKRKPARSKPTVMLAGKTSIKPFEVCNHFGMHLREIFEKEHAQNRQVQLGEVFEYLLKDLHGAWKMVNLYGKEMPVEKLRGKANPIEYDL